MADTEDVVQQSILQTLRRIDRFEVRHELGLQAYLRQAVMNGIRDELRHRARTPERRPLDPRYPAPAASPLDVAIGVEAVERYERALERLRPDDRAAVVARIEMGYTNEQIAVALNKPSVNAARMAVERALVRLARQMAQTD